MSTRGVVAVGTEKSWRGVYNHSDSYPSYLGEDISAELRDWLAEGKSLKSFCERLLRYTDWREFKNSGLCPYCGIIGKGQPHSIDGRIYFIAAPSPDIVAEELERLRNSDDPFAKEILENIKRTGFPDPECKYHEHTRDDRSPAEEHHITSDNPDPLFMEWVYIINPIFETITVLHHVSDPCHKEGKIRKEPVRRRGGWWDYGHCRYKHIKVATVSIKDAVEGRVDWKEIERKGEKMRDDVEFRLLFEKYRNKDRFIIDGVFRTLIYYYGMAVIVENITSPEGSACRKNVVVYRGDKATALKIYLSYDFYAGESSLRELGLRVQVAERRGADAIIVE